MDRDIYKKMAKIFAEISSFFIFMINESVDKSRDFEDTKKYLNFFKKSVDKTITA